MTIPSSLFPTYQSLYSGVNLQPTIVSPNEQIQIGKMETINEYKVGKWSQDASNKQIMASMTEYDTDDDDVNVGEDEDEDEEQEEEDPSIMLPDGIENEEGTAFALPENVPGIESDEGSSSIPWWVWLVGILLILGILGGIYFVVKK
jgi:hypothetical protein